MRIWILLPALLAASCISVNWQRGLRETEPARETLDALVPGEVDLTTCLAELGAPIWVLEYPVEGGQGAILAYGWLERGGLRFRGSIPIRTLPSPSFTYGTISEDTRGVLLFFDHDWQLVRSREGRLKDLTADVERRRPLYVEGDDELRERHP